MDTMRKGGVTLFVGGIISPHFCAKSVLKHGNEDTSALAHLHGEWNLIF